jgi:ATP-binding cassette subfamily F protein 3
MSLIVVDKASLSFGPQRVLVEASVRIGEGDRIGLVGANGSGKSTLLRVMVGEQSIDEGQVNRAKGCRVGYLPQDASEVSDEPLITSVLSSVPGRGDIEGRLEEAREALEASDDPDEQMRMASQLAELGDKLEHFELHYSEHQAKRILKGLGFSQTDLTRPIDEFSGGWRMRAALAGLLFQQPDVLFLDEPTNHLDVPSVLWFKRFLDEYKRATVLICHDREFLNRHIERVLSFEPEGLRGYRGDYDAYLQQRESEEEVIEAQARSRDRQVKELERFVDRFRAKATKARQAQSRVKQIERMQRNLDAPVARPRRLKFTFPPVQRSGKDVVTVTDLSKAYGDNVLYRALSRGIYAGDRVAIIGANGVGKTTLLKMLAQEITPDAGEIRYGSNVEPGYFAQHHTELLDLSNTVLEEVRRICPGTGESFVRGVCGAFLFSGDDVDKSVKILSGGERARVLLARLLARPGNLLLMDEPTTHLDIAAAEALAEALAGYGGTLVFVSHNTAFVNRLATKIWDVVDADIEEYPGTLAEYHEHQARQEAEALQEAERRAGKGKSKGKGKGKGKGKSKSEAQGESTGESKSKSKSGEAPQQASAPEPAPGESRQARQERKRREAQRRNEMNQRTKKIRAEVDKLEQRIAALEQEKIEIEPQLADPQLYADQAKFLPLLGRFNTCKDDLERLMERWERRGADLEQVEAQFKRDEQKQQQEPQGEQPQGQQPGQKKQQPGQKKKQRRGKKKGQK